MRRSRTEDSLGLLVPLAVETSQLEPPPAAQEPQAAVAPPSRHCAEVPTDPPRLIPRLKAISPFCFTVNLARPLEEAVKISPLPELSTRRPAKLVLPEKEA